MKSFFLKIFLLGTFLTQSFDGFSQRDSITDSIQKFDIEKLKLDKKFTQNITIKGEDLEKFASQNLEGSINAWFFGAYQAKASMIYIVDGNIKMT